MLSKMIKQVLCTFFYWVIALFSFAQKLPNKQETSVRAPQNIKIDGKLMEWNNQFQAYNHATEIFYTISNDDENLYLTIQIRQPEIINKIFGSGIDFAIQSSPDKNKNILNITYPFTENQAPYFNLSQRKSSEDIDTSAKYADSVMMHNNYIIGQKCKLIKVTGAKLPDTLMSVYNEDGVKAAGLFDKKKFYNYEMAVSLKLIGLSTKDIAKLKYHLILNGKHVAFGNTAHDANGNPAPPNPVIAQMLADLNTFSAHQSATTDFFGEYTLAKKP